MRVNGAAHGAGFPPLAGEMSEGQRGHVGATLVVTRLRKAQPFPSPFCLGKPLSLPLSEGELKGVPAQRDAGGSRAIATNT